MNKSEWISAKIRKLMAEGKSQSQSTAIAFAMYNQENKMQEGGMQQAGMWFDPNNPFNLQNQMFSPQQDFYNPNNRAYFQAIGGAMINGGTPQPPMMSQNMMQMQPQNFAKPSISMEEPSNPNPFYTSQNTPYPSFLETSGADYMNLAVNPSMKSLGDESAMYMRGDTNVDGTVNENDRIKSQSEFNRINLANLYGGISPQEYGYRFGESLQNRDAFGSVVTGLGLGLGTAKNILTGYGNAKQNNYAYKSYKDRLGDLSRNYERLEQGGYTKGQPLEYYMAEGGSMVTPNQLLTGEYLAENPDAMMQANVEIEDSEKVLNSQTGEIQTAVGETHETGGIKTSLPEGSQVLSDFTKINAKNAKYFRDTYDINIKADDTFAKALDKIEAKIGLKKLIKEEEEIQLKIEKQLQKENPDEQTTNINLQFLSEEARELEIKKEPLQDLRKLAFEDVFERQEMIPKKQDNKAEMQEGGQMQQPNPQQIIEAFAQMNQINPQEILAQLQSMSPEDQQTALGQMLKTLQGGQQSMQEEQIEGQMSNPQEESMEMKCGGEMKYMNEGGELQYMDGGGTKKKPNPLITKSTEITNFEKSPSVIDRLPYTPRETNPNEIWQGDNYVNVWEPLVSSTLTDPVQAKKVDEWLMANKGTYSPNIQKQLEGLSGVERYAKIQQLATDGKPGPFHNAVREALASTTEVPEVAKVLTGNVQKVGERTVLPFIPTYYGQPPSPQEPVLKGEISLGRLDPTKISVEPNLVEAQRQVASAQGSLEGLSPQQRASIEGALYTQNQNATNQAISQAQIANDNSQRQVDMFNIGQASKEDLTNLENNLNFEARTLGGKAKYEANLNRYFNNIAEQEQKNYQGVQNLNYLNQMNDTFQTDGTNFYRSAPDPVTYNSVGQNGKQLTEAQKLAIKEQEIKDMRKLYLKTGKIS